MCVYVSHSARGFFFSWSEFCGEQRTVIRRAQYVITIYLAGCVNKCRMVGLTHDICAGKLRQHWSQWKGRNVPHTLRSENIIHNWRTLQYVFWWVITETDRHGKQLGVWVTSQFEETDKFHWSFKMHLTTKKWTTCWKKFFVNKTKSWNTNRTFT
jgi:hypothetical protein